MQNMRNTSGCTMIPPPFLNILQYSFILGSYCMCVHSGSITNGVSIFSCYVCSVRKQRKDRVDAVLYVILSSRKQTFFHCNGFNTSQGVCLGCSGNTKDLEIRFSAVIRIELLLSLLPCLRCPSDVRAGVSSLQPHSLGASSVCRCMSLCVCICTKYYHSLQG